MFSWMRSTESKERKDINLVVTNKQNNREVGTIKEQLALSYVESFGAVEITRNFRCRMGEIDLIYKDGAYTVFAEVKYRRTTFMGMPEEAVTLKKQRIISKVADYFLLTRHLPRRAYYRFDVIAITGDEIRWYKNAFPYRSRSYS